MQRFFKLDNPILFLLIITGAIFIFNFSPSTYLSGWDNLHAEFDFGLNIKRSIFSVWQGNQGLGHVAGNAHAADLPRQLLLLPFSFLPLNLIRQAYVFLMLAFGPIGTYLLIKKLLSYKYQALNKLIPILGSLFYLFNLATIQIFYVPFEPFITHFAALPWLLLSALYFIAQDNKKSLLLLVIVNLLAIPQGQVPTVFFVYLFSLSFFLLVLVIETRRKSILKKCVQIMSLTLIINAFWLLPFLYFALTNSHVAINAKINQMATETVYSQNKEFGNILDVMLLKGFWFNNVDLNLHHQFDYMLSPWRQHLAPLVSAIGYLFFLIILLGFALVKKKMPFVIPFSALFLLSFTMLATDTPPFSWIDEAFRKIPLFSEVFRFPFTKFSTLAALTYAFFFSVGIGKLMAAAKESRFGEKIKPTYIFVFSLALFIIFIFPVFRGHLFYDKVKVVIPKEYFQLFDYLKTKDKTLRIANFPQHTFWGWNFYKWGYGGSGFLWYGIEQPILDRAFDVWSKNNENYYWEISHALYSKNAQLFENVLEKYQISWLVLDHNVVSVQSPKELQLSTLAELLKQSDKIILAERFGNLWVYKVILQTKPENFVFLAKDLPSIAPTYQWNNYDQAYRDQGNYINTQPNDIYYPFRSLFTGRKQSELEFKVKDNGDYFSFYAHLPKTLAGSTLIVPQLFQEEIEEVDLNNFKESILKYPEIYIDNELILAPVTVSKDVSAKKSSQIPLPYIRTGDLEVRIPKIKGYYHYENTPHTMDITPKSCNSFNSDIFRHDKIYEENYVFLRLTSINSSNCIDIDLTALSSRLGYLMSIESRNIAGKSLLLYLNSITTEHSDLQTYLPKIKEKTTSYFIIPPMDEYSIGYKIHLDNISIGKESTINDIGKITVNQIPYQFLTSLNIKKNLQTQPISSTTIKDISVVHANPSHYAIKTSPIDKLSYLVLSQSYDSGWKAYKIQNSESRIQNWMNNIFPFVFGKELKEHVLVNNWANGWLLPESLIINPSSFIIIYWPQYLEYLGIGILIGTFVWIFYLFRKIRS